MLFKRNDRRPDSVAPRPNRTHVRRDALSPLGIRINTLKPLIPWAS